MPNRILMLDQETHVRAVAIILRHELRTEVDITESLDEAKYLLRKNKYGCLVVEPFDLNYFGRGREREGLFPSFIRETRTAGTPVVISSTYLEEDFQKSFGMGQSEYDAYQAKPWDTDEFLKSVRKALKK